MIKKCSIDDIDLVKKIVDKHKIENAYLYIDLNIYGYDNDIVKTYISYNEKGINVILYQYYNSLQVIQDDAITVDDLDEIVSFIKKNDFERISGNYLLLSEIEKKSNYKITSGYIFKYDNNNKIKLSGRTKLATNDDCKNISQLICDNENFGKQYNVDQLTDQLIERMNNKNCKNVIIVDINNNVVSHAATYADINDMAVVAGVITEKNNEGKGYGKTVLNDITYFVIVENKIPILYCYEMELFNWYENQGWKKIVQCAKLEKKKSCH